MGCAASTAVIPTAGSSQQAVSPNATQGFSWSDSFGTTRNNLSAVIERVIAEMNDDFKKKISTVSDADWRPLCLGPGPLHGTSKSCCPL